MQFTYPEQLPVSAHKDEIASAITEHQVVIISGQTGSGKTTQIPKIALELGFGSHGKQIVHTQPRRIAARSVASRIAEECQVPLGQEVGFQVRFEDTSAPSTRLRVVTDGILLAQIQHDPRLEAYDLIIIDEAHERSLNIDFLLGYLSQLLPTRHDLKLIITSATIDAEKFKEHFEHVIHDTVPVIEVSGRTYPVEILYEPIDGPTSLLPSVRGFHNPATTNLQQNSSTDIDADSQLDMPQAVTRACAELIAYSQHVDGPRDILVFAASERDIHDYQTQLTRYFGQRVADTSRHDAIEIVPLYARLSTKEQHRVFEPHQHQRIVLATNVAETSLTVPGIRYVVDTGLARISRYSKASKVQRLPIEPISQASANQRSGRCGRLADGIAIRLYSEEDFASRDVFTEPEILRTSLASVILHMLAVGVAHHIDDVTNFGFIDSPDTKAIAQGFQDLLELRAVKRTRGKVMLTHIGRQIAQLPIDVRFARMVNQASRNTPNTLAAVLVIVAFLSLQDPRERPQEAQDEADRIHNRYADPTSDFLTILNIWDRFFQLDGDPTNRQLRALCKQEYMNMLRMRQWRDLVAQLTRLCKNLHMRVGAPVPSARPDFAIVQLPLAQQGAHSMVCSWDSEGIHRAMLAGLLSSMGMQRVTEPKASQFTGLSGAAKAKAMRIAAKRARNEYVGSRGTHFALFPASSLAKHPPAWVIAAELVETSRLWARFAASIDPAWAEDLAGNLTRTTYAEPHWSASRGSAMAQATVLLFGLPIVTGRTVQWGKINPVEARELLIRQGFVEGQYQQHFHGESIIAANRAVLEESDNEAHRTRQVALQITDQDLFDFYDRVLPEHIVSIAAFAAWWKQEQHQQPHLLDFDAEKVERLQDSEHADLADYPDTWHTTGTDGSSIALKLSYLYNPQSEQDGVTVHIPLHALSRLSEDEFTWNVPGLLQEQIVATIKALPKPLRVHFVPAPDTASAMLDWFDSHQSAPEIANIRSSEGQPVDTPAIKPFFESFTQAALEVVQAPIHPSVFDQALIERLPAYVKLHFSIEQTIPTGKAKTQSHHRKHTAPQVRVLATGDNLHSLRTRFAQQAAQSARATVTKRAQAVAQQGNVIESANMLHQAGATLHTRAQMVYQALYNALALPPERISSRWLGKEALVLAAAPYDSTQHLVHDMQYAAVQRLVPHPERIGDDEALALTLADIEHRFEDTVYEIAHDVIAIIERKAQVDQAISGPAPLPLLAVLQSIREHSDALVHSGFLADTPAEVLPLIPKYLQADVLRLEKAKRDAARDATWTWQVQEAQQLVEQAEEQAKHTPAGVEHDQAVERASQARWMLEEFRVSLWAQELGTIQPISLKRIRKALQ